MTGDTSGVERALGAIGTTFRLSRLYPPTHPALVEAMRQVGGSLPSIVATGPVEFKIGATGLHWHGQQLVPRNTQVSELAGLLYARGVRTIQIKPGLAPEHILALFGVATGSVAVNDESLGFITLGLGRRSRMSADVKLLLRQFFLSRAAQLDGGFIPLLGGLRCPVEPISEYGM